MLLRLLTPVLSALVIRRLKVGEAEAVAAMAEAEAILAQVDQLLGDGRPFLLPTHQPSYIGRHPRVWGWIYICIILVQPGQPSIPA